MQKLLPLKYTLAFSLYLVSYISFSLPGYWAYALVIYGYGIIPFLELFYKPNYNNPESALQESRIYDYLLYATNV